MGINDELISSLPLNYEDFMTYLLTRGRVYLEMPVECIKVRIVRPLS